jgi:hypothetical protein
MKSAIQKFDERVRQGDRPALDVPRNISFNEFLHKYARVRVGSEFVPYTTAGRAPLAALVATIDFVLGNDVSYVPDADRLALFGTLEFGKIVTDAHIYACGGAQFGKTVLSLHLKEYLASVKWRHSYYVLPDDDLVQAIVDGKERPEVLDQIPWLNEMISVGKSVNESGKTVSRKGAMLFTDGKRSAMTYMRGMAKVPTSISADCVIQDETDDVPPDRSRFLHGRMTSSDLRLFVAIGTQRYHGAGQNKLFESGSQHVGLIRCQDCKARWNPEDEWPGIARLAMDGAPAPSDPRLSLEGDFRRNGERVAEFEHDGPYYYACPKCGCPLDPDRILFEARRPERIKARRWSIRVSQMCCAALPLKMIVADWCQNAVRDPDAMAAFACDRLAKPKSARQQLEPAHLDRARSQDPFTLSLAPAPAAAIRYAGMDTGDRCWFVCRERRGPAEVRLIWAEHVSPERARERIPLLFSTLSLSCLFVDIGAERNLARDLCLILNGLRDWSAPRIESPEKAYIHMPNGVAWDGPAGHWKGLRCAAVEFSRKPGAGTLHKLGITPDGDRFFPVVAANRDETIGQAVRELLTAEDGVVEVINGTMRTAPTLRLPASGPGTPAAIEDLDAHLLAGSRLIEDAKGEKHYADSVPNHYLLALAYARLGEVVGGRAGGAARFEFEPVRESAGMSREPHACTRRQGVTV